LEWLKLSGTTRCAEIVSPVLGAAAGMGLIPKDLVDRVQKKASVPEKSDNCLDEILGI